MHDAEVQLSSHLVDHLLHVVLEINCPQRVMSARQPLSPDLLDHGPHPLDRVQPAAELRHQDDLQPQISAVVPEHRALVHLVLVEEHHSLARQHR